MRLATIASTIEALVAGVKQTASMCLFTQTASKTVSNTTVETTLVSTGVGTVTLPANFFVAGKTIRIIMRGHNSTANPAGTMTFRIKLGATTVLATPASTATNGLVNRAFDIQCGITCRTTGAAGTVFAEGTVLRSTGATTSVRWEMVNTAATTINTTTSQTIDVTVQWSTAAVSNTITATTMVVQIFN